MKILGFCLFLFLITPKQVFAFEQENDPPEVIRAGSAVYQIRLPHGIGTGFFIAPNLLVTHFRLIKSVKNINEISLYFDDQLSPIKVKRLVAVSYPYDLAVLETQGESSVYLSETSTVVNLKGRFWTIGYPDTNALQYHHSISPVIWNDDYLAASFNFGHGDGANGSPVIDSSGRFVGIIFAKMQSQKFFINSRYVKLLTEGRIGTLCTSSLRECVRHEVLRTKEMVQQFLNGGPKVGVLHVFTGKKIVEKSLHKFYGRREPLPGLTNDVVRKKDDEAFLRRLATDFNSAIAQIYMGHRKFWEGGNYNRQSASAWYVQAAFQNHPVAFHDLGINEVVPKYGIVPSRRIIRKKSDLSGVFYFFEKAVELGLPEGEYSQGMVFEALGRMPEAFEYYKRAANAGVPQAQLALGRMLQEQGQREESQEWLDRALKQGFAVPKPNIIKRGWNQLCEVKISSLTNN